MNTSNAQEPRCCTFPNASVKLLTTLGLTWHNWSL